jgi:hypothetical protein
MSDMGATIQDNNDDDDLMLELKEAVAGERSSPEQVMDAAKAAFEWREVDKDLELLSLSYDSSLAGLVGVRGATTAAPRMLVFDGAHVTIELEVDTDVLMGQVVPAESDQVILESADGHVDETDTDDAGVFLLRRPARGPVRVRCRHRGLDIVTGWMAI